MQIETQSQALGAGASFQMGSGSFLRILECSAGDEITVKAWDNNNREIINYAYAKAGFEFDLREKQSALNGEAFTRVLITSATAQTVRAVVTDKEASVDFNEFSGTMSLAGAEPACQNFAYTTATSTGAGSTYWLADGNSRKRVLVQADTANTGTVKLTDGTNNFHTLNAGDSLELAVGGTIKWRFSAAAPDKVYFMEQW